MHTAFDHPQFSWPRFSLSAPPIRWQVIPGIPCNPTYVDADDVAMEWYGKPPDDDWAEPEPACPYRFTDHEALECWSGNCHLAAHELLDAMRTRLSEPPMPMPVLRHRFTLLRLWYWLTGQQ